MNKICSGNNKEVIITVGNIGSGKSTYINKIVQNLEKDTFIVISRDSFRKELSKYDFKKFSKSKQNGYIYDPGLEEFINRICTDFYESFLYLSTPLIIFDETNMTRKSREKYLDLAYIYHYSTNCIVFPDLGEDEHIKRRLNNNHGNTSEKRWREVYNDFKDEYQEPTKEEGFDNITFIKKDDLYSFNTNINKSCIQKKRKIPKYDIILN